MRSIKYSGQERGEFWKQNILSILKQNKNSTRIFCMLIKNQTFRFAAKNI